MQKEEILKGFNLKLPVCGLSYVHLFSDGSCQNN